MFSLPGGVQEANGAAAAHGVAHGGDAVQVLLLCPAVHAEKGPAEPHDKAAWRAKAPRVLNLLQVLSVSDRAAPARGLQAPGREAVCLRGVWTQSLESQRSADAHQGQAQKRAALRL